MSPWKDYINNSECIDKQSTLRKYIAQPQHLKVNGQVNKYKVTYTHYSNNNLYTNCKSI